MIQALWTMMQSQLMSPPQKEGAKNRRKHWNATPVINKDMSKRIVASDAVAVTKKDTSLKTVAKHVNTATTKDTSGRSVANSKLSKLPISQRKVKLESPQLKVTTGKPHLLLTQSHLWIASTK